MLFFKSEYTLPTLPVLKIRSRSDPPRLGQMRETTQLLLRSYVDRVQRCGGGTKLHKCDRSQKSGSSQTTMEVVGCETFESYEKSPSPLKPANANAAFWYLFVFCSAVVKTFLKWYVFSL